ncbi:hypothetical protein QCA50_017529 [Cerrena zonata]|uniref:RRM Nup35-type domain-containing protein n=1 Tax=Cerrena zonata TaxID=2478898 RepID=A0AAW0FKD1_9APHY
MYNSTYSSPTQDPNARPQFTHSHSTQYGQPFTVAGMSNPTNVTSPNLRGGTSSSGSGLNVSGMGGSLGDSLAQSRSHYQSGYLMSSQPNPSASQQHQRHDDVPIVQTKATLNNILSSASASDFGMGSMFETSRERQRQTLADEDAPPTASVDDIINEVYIGTPSRRKSQAQFDASARASYFRPASSQMPSTPKPSSSASNVNNLLYVVVFGYPADKYSVTAEYFKSLGDSTGAEQNNEIMNCFRIGYSNPTDALRAVRKNGEIIGGHWMVGAKWADPAQAESILGAPLARPNFSLSDPNSPDVNMLSSSPPALPPPPSTFSPTPGSFSSNHLALTRHDIPGSPSVGTPIRLAPSASAYRKGGTPAPVVGGGGPKPGEGFTGFMGTPGASQQDTPSKGMLGQVSDLIFGW